MLRALDGSAETSGFALVDWPPCMQICLKVKDTKDVEKVKENCRKIFFGLRTKCDGKSFLKREGPEHITKLPDYISDVKTAAEYVHLNSLPATDALASIMYNDHIVAINTHHRVCDGEYALQAIKHIFDDDIENPGVCPVRVSEAYKDQIQYVKDHMPTDVYPNTELTQLKVKGKDEPVTNGPNTIITEFDSKKLQCYDTKLKRPVGLTDAIWSATSLAMNTLENDFSKYCINTCYNMRTYLPNWKNDWNYCDQYSTPNINAKHHTMDMTIRELGAEFRKHFNYLKKDCGLMYPKNFPYVPTYPHGVYMNVSNLGPQKLDPRLEDMYMQATHEGPGMETYLYYFTYSKITKDQNTFLSRLRFPREAISSKTAHVLNESINHILVDIPTDTKLGEAIPEIRDFQGKLDKIYKNI